MSTKKIMIVMVRRESVLTSWLRDASTFALVVALIGVGVALESPAMQWFGAIVAFTTILIQASGSNNAHTYDLDGAQAELDRLKAESKG